MRIVMNIAAGVFGAALAASAATAGPLGGPYVGVEAGYESYPEGFDGPALDIVAGYDLPLNERWFVGVEARLGRPFSESTTRRDLGDLTATSEVTLENRYGARLRLGRSIGERWTAYASAGVERFDVQAVRTIRPKASCRAPVDCSVRVQDFSFEEDVRTLGAGAEWRFRENWRARFGYERAEGDAYERNAASAALIRAF